MENNEIMTNEDKVIDCEYEDVDETSGIGLGKGLAIGAGVIGAGVALFMLGKKAWTKIKEKKAQKTIHVVGPEDEK